MILSLFFHYPPRAAGRFRCRTGSLGMSGLQYLTVGRSELKIRQKFNHMKFGSHFTRSLSCLTSLVSLAFAKSG
jgi:hypothetical protein